LAQASFSQGKWPRDHLACMSKAAPIPHPSADYTWKLQTRDYEGDKQRRDEARRLEAEARSRAREAGEAVNLGAAAAEWERVAQGRQPPLARGTNGKGSSEPNSAKARSKSSPPISGRKGKSSGKGKGSGGATPKSRPSTKGATANKRGCKSEDAWSSWKQGGGAEQKKSSVQVFEARSGEASGKQPSVVKHMEDAGWAHDTRANSSSSIVSDARKSERFRESAKTRAHEDLDGMQGPREGFANGAPLSSTNAKSKASMTHGGTSFASSARDAKDKSSSGFQDVANWWTHDPWAEAKDAWGAGRRSGDASRGTNEELCQDWPVEVALGPITAPSSTSAQDAVLVPPSPCLEGTGAGSHDATSCANKDEADDAAAQVPVPDSSDEGEQGVADPEESNAVLAMKLVQFLRATSRVGELEQAQHLLRKLATARIALPGTGIFGINDVETVIASFAQELKCTAFIRQAADVEKACKTLQLASAHRIALGDAGVLSAETVDSAIAEFRRAHSPSPMPGEGNVVNGVDRVLTSRLIELLRTADAVGWRGETTSLLRKGALARTALPGLGTLCAERVEAAVTDFGKERRCVDFLRQAADARKACEVLRQAARTGIQVGQAGVLSADLVESSISAFQRGSSKDGERAPA